MNDLQYGEVFDSEFSQLIDLYRYLQPKDPIISDNSDFVVFKDIQASEWLFLLGARNDKELIASTYVNVIS